MIHLAPLPGSPQWDGDLGAVQERALADAAALVEGGFSALMVENYYDIPFYQGSVPAHTVAAMAVLVAEIHDCFPGVALGVNVLRNDVASALGIAVATGAGFVRVNVHTGATVTDQGSLEGQAWHTIRLRRELGADHVGILADVRVKHARPLAERPLAEEAQDLRWRGLADGVIITGAATGSGASTGDLEVIRAALPDCPLLIGSGLTRESLPQFFPMADACIVGSSLKTARADLGCDMISPDLAKGFIQTLSNIK